MEINRETGAIQHIYSPYEREVTSPATHLKQEFFESVISDSLEQFRILENVWKKLNFRSSAGSKHRSFTRQPP